MSITIKDVAKETGFSIATVSKALNNNPSISNSTVEKIKKTAEKLNYKPNVRAKNFASKTTKTIVFLASLPKNAGFKNPHLFEIIQGTISILDENGYSLVLKSRSKQDALKFIDQFYETQFADAIIFHGSVMSKALAKKIEKLNILHTVIGNPGFINKLCWIDTDNKLSGELAAQHLLSKGYRDVYYIGGEKNDMTSNYRLEGLKTIFSHNGIVLDDQKIIYTSSTISDGAWATNRIIKQNKLPRAIVCANNPICLGCLQTLQNKKIRVPEDVALITFDTYPFSLTVKPQLTVVDIDMFALGTEVGSFILEKIKRPATLFQAYKTIPELKVRDST
ncbi:MAG: LacI family DNA-binding transcriptional regulator [Sphaerochaetaceae bacterium]|nr:LacI family DNA-binding transcriptional regulator [Sphaerochaetaceae bacterium]